MTLDQLRVFVAVAERQHMTRAAAALNIAQSAASAAIAALESRHGIRLFQRVGRGIELTEAGSIFLAEARAVLDRADAAAAVLADLGGLKRGTLRLRASQTIASYWLPRHLAAFRRAWPGVELRLGIANTAEVAQAIQAGSAELGFIEGQIAAPLLHITPVARDQLVIVVGAEHPWVRNPPRKPEALASGEWVLREAGSGTRSAFEEALEGFGLPAGRLNVVMELPSNEAVRAAVEAGLGASALSASVAAAGIEAGLLHAVPMRLPERAFSVVRHAARPPGRAASALLAMLMPARAAKSPPLRKSPERGSKPG